MFNSLRRLAQQLFGFSKTEANGFLILIVVVILAIVVPIVSRWIAYQDPYLPEEDQRELDSLVQVLEARRDSASLTSVYPDSSITYRLQHFDPNQVTRQELMEFGLSKEVANRWLKYREAGGRFDSPQDIGKVYGLTDEEVNRLLPFAVVAERNSLVRREVAEPVQASPTPGVHLERASFDLNQADTIQLKSIHGIGEVLSVRIVKFRESLGGFVSLSQIAEVYGIEDYAVENARDMSFIDEEFVPRQIDLNASDVRQLAAHPYISSNEARVIVAYRDQHGPFKEIRDLQEIHLIDSVWLERVAPYLKTGPFE